MSNIGLAEQVISQLVCFHGVRTFCLSPGGRNAPLVSVISKTQDITIFSFFDERAMGFFALGRAKRDKKPVVVVTTSGTAVAELLPSVVEAHYSHIPLVLITADRPSAYRGTGAPQSIEQKGIFGPYVGQLWDLENTLDFDLSEWDRLKPCHINVCFDEPLLDQKTFGLPNQHTHNFHKKKKDVSSDKREKEETKQIRRFFKKCQKPLCLLTEMPEDKRRDTEKILHFFGWPVYAEALSHLRESKKLFILNAGEKILSWLVLNKKIDGVVRIGRRPVARFWRDLEKTYADVPILSVSDQSYSGLNRAQPAISFKTFFKWALKEMANHSFQKHLLVFPKLEQEQIRKKDRFQRDCLKDLLQKHPLSEPALIRDFSQKIPQHSLLFLGNSLPIREWNGVATYAPDKKIKFLGQRGANGIDGLISSFLGTIEPNRANWCLIGDLSALYDLSSLWAFHQLKKKPACFIVVVNNSGGQIFSSLFNNPLFINAHSLNFKGWAEMWGFHYYSVKKWPDKLSFLSPAVIELKVDPKHTKLFEKAFQTQKI